MDIGHVCGIKRVDEKTASAEAGRSANNESSCSKKQRKFVKSEKLKEACFW